MAGIKTAADVSGAASGSLWVDFTDVGTYPPMGIADPVVQSVSCSCVGASVSVTVDYKMSSGAVGWSNGVGTKPTGMADDSWAALNAIMSPISAANGIPSTNWAGTIWRVSAHAGGDTDSFLVVGGKYQWTTLNPLQIHYAELSCPPQEFAFTITASGLYIRRDLVETIPDDYMYLLDTRQRISTDRVYVDEDTTCSATIGSASASGSYGAGAETEVYDMIGLSIALSNAPNVAQNYATITISGGFGIAGSAIDLTNLLFYQDTHTAGSNGHDGSKWHWHGACLDPNSYDYTAVPTGSALKWRTVPSGGTIGLQRGAGVAANTPISWGGSIQFHAVTLYPRLWKGTLDASDTDRRYTSYDDSAGEPFDIGKYRHYKAGGERQTEAEVSVAPSWDGIGIYEQWFYGVGNQYTYGIPDDVFRVITNIGNGITVRLRDEWLAANGEDVGFTDPRTFAAATDVLCPITVQPTDAADLFSSPFRSGWLTASSGSVNLDIPDGCTERPSPWIDAGVEVTNDGQNWRVPTTGGSVKRGLGDTPILPTRRRNRVRRFGSGAWPNPLKEDGSGGEYHTDWTIATRANDADMMALDDPRWADPEATPHAGDEAGCLTEDVTDWRGFGGVIQLEVGGCTEDMQVTLKLGYRTLAVSDPCYLSAGAEFGSVAEDPASATWSERHTAQFTATLDHETGIVKWDLQPDGGSALADLELVETLEIAFGTCANEQTLQFEGFTAESFDGVTGGRVRNRTAHLILSDYFGMGIEFCGGKNYQPSYGYGGVRNEGGLYRIQFQQHPPSESEEVPPDPRYLKTLARYHNEAALAQLQETVTLDQAAIDAALENADGASLGTVYCTDWDECYGGALRAGTVIGNGRIDADIILQGGARGIAKDGGVRECNLSDGSMELYRSDDAGVTKDQVATSGTSAVGEWELWQGPEKSPATYYLRTSAGDLPIGSLVNAECVWYAYFDDRLWYTLGKQYNGRILRICVNSSGSVSVQSRGPAATDPWIAEGSPFADTGWYRPRIIERDDGSFLACATKDGETRFAKCTARAGASAVWTVIDLPTIGSTFDGAAIFDRDGNVHAVGYDRAQQKVQLQMSSDADLSADTITPGVSTLDVCDLTVATGAAAPTCDVLVQDCHTIMVSVSDATAGTTIYTCTQLDQGFSAVT